MLNLNANKKKGWKEAMVIILSPFWYIPLFILGMINLWKFLDDIDPNNPY